MKVAAIMVVMAALTWPFAAMAEGGSNVFATSGHSEPILIRVICDMPACKCADAARAGFADQAVSLCSAVLSDPKTDTSGEATAFLGRGLARTLQHRYDDAIADNTQALALDLKLNLPAFIATAYRNRADDYLRSNDDRDADDDYSAAIAARDIDPQFYVARADAYVLQGKMALASADYQAAADRIGRVNREKFDDGGDMFFGFPGGDVYLARGQFLLLSGQYDQAAGDFVQTVALEPEFPLGVLWLHYARLRQGRDDGAEFAADVSRLDSNVRDSPIVKLFLGTASPDDVQRATANPGAPFLSDAACEGEFALAEWSAFTKHDGAAAKAHYQTVATSCPRSLEVAVAQAMLQKPLANLPR
jgi:tetratricopeptide (TPR) repeat protein